MLGCVAHAHRKKLNQKLILPSGVKDIFRCPRDETNPAKLELLCTEVRHEVEGHALVHLRTRDMIEFLAKSVEICATGCVDEVGERSEPQEQVVPAGARLMVDAPAHLPLKVRRTTVTSAAAKQHQRSKERSASGGWALTRCR